MAIADIVGLYVECIGIALPFTITFWICDYIVQKFLSAALGGRLTFRA